MTRKQLDKLKQQKVRIEEKLKKISEKINETENSTIVCSKCSSRIPNPKFHVQSECFDHLLAMGEVVKGEDGKCYSKHDKRVIFSKPYKGWMYIGGNLTKSMYSSAKMVKAYLICDNCKRKKYLGEYVVELGDEQEVREYNDFI